MNNRKLKELVQDRKTFGNVDPVEAVLFLTSRYSLLPDIFDIFGREQAIEFLERFGGKTIKIPSVKNVEEAIQQLVIWKALTADDSQENYKRLSSKYGLKESELRTAKQRVQDMFNEQRKRFGRPEQETRQRDKAGAESATEEFTVLETRIEPAVYTAGAERDIAAYLTANLFGVGGGREGASSTVPPSDSTVDR